MNQDELMFSWRHKFLSHGIDVAKAQKEFERIKRLYGKLTAKNVLEASRPKKSLLHNCFEWNDGIAAEKYRLQQARVLINNVQVSIVSSGGDTLDIPFYEVVKDKKGKRNYVDVSSIVNNTSYSDQIRSKAKSELHYWKNKYEIFTELRKAIVKVDAALEAL